MIRKDGGTAFPMQDRDAINDYALEAAKKSGAKNVDERDQAYLAARAEAIGGMSLRDYFAAKALQGFMSRTLIAGFDDEMICQRSYEIADQMITARDEVTE